MRMHPGIAGAVLVIGAALAASAAPTAAQDVSASFGSSFYDSDEFCLNSSAFITDYSVGASGDLFGVSAAYDNSDWPWPPPFPTGGGGGLVVPAAFLRFPAARQEQFYLSQGEAFRVVADVFALELLRRVVGGDEEGGLARIDRFVRPVFGVGFQYSTDGETAAAGEGRNFPTYGVRGGTNLLIQYGARVYLPSREQRVRIQLEYRGTSMFVDSFELETPAGNILTRDGETLTWSDWSVGVSFRLGG
jgi:hypothetical protein